MSTEKERETHTYLAKLAKQAERYDEMVESMKQVAKLDVDLSVEERNLLSVDTRMLSVLGELHEAKGNENNANLIKSYCKKVLDEPSKICYDILDVIDKHLIPSSAFPREAFAGNQPRQRQVFKLNNKKKLS